MIVSTDNDGIAQIDLRKLATRLSGTAHLRSVAIEESFELSRTIGSRMSAYNGAIRIYMPGLEQATEDPFQHPLWLAPQNGLNSRVLNQVASRVLPLGFRDSEGDTRFSQIGLLRQAASRAAANAATGSREEQLLAEINALRSERDSAREAAQNADSLMYEEASKNSVLSSSLSALQEETFTLRERVRFSEVSTSRPSLDISPEDIHALFERDPPLEVTLRVLANVFQDRVLVLQSAYDSARSSFAFRYRNKAFDLIWSLCTLYWTALDSGEGDVTARRCFGSSYAAKEAASLSVAGRKRRTFEVKGHDFLMEKHLKIGVADNKADTLRLHFE